VVIKGGGLLNGLALFAGVAGLDLGVRISIPSARTVCYVEGEAYAASVLVSQMEKGGLHPAPIWSDVVSFDGRPWRGKVDFITAGFPCQPWSKAGKLKKTDDERWLWEDIERIICEVRPQYLFLENVPGIIDGGISHILGSLAKRGFNAEWGCLKASEIGANHHRDRAFIFAYCTERGCTLSHYFSDGFFPRWHHDKKSSKRKSSQRRMEGDKSSIMRESLPNSIGDGFQKQWRPWFSEKALPSIECYSWWETEPSVGRVVDGMANRVDRLRACGNGVVPLQAGVAYSVLIQRAIERGGLIC